jgi:hypothetical protein
MKAMENDNQNLNVEDLGKNVESVGVSMPPELPSHQENKEKLIETLHKDGPLPNLRTYHGDIAEFIKSKDQSLSDIALKEHEKKREKQEKEVKKEERRAPKEEKEAGKSVLERHEESQNRPSKAPTNALIYLISLVLILGAAAAASYLFIFNKNNGPINVTEEKTLVPAKKTVILDFSGVSGALLADTFESFRGADDYKNGITAILISDAGKKIGIVAETLADTLKLNMPSALKRSLGGEFMLGFYADNISSDFFLILRIKDYPIAFRDMLKWEESIQSDFGPLLKPGGSATSTQYIFKDLIVRNKDTRAAISSAGKVRLIYTFLNKETILITESENAIKELLDAYIAGNTVR